jgi:transcriptional regulator with XRE-family HTH domain
LRHNSGGSGGASATMSMTAHQVDAHVGRRMRERREALQFSQGSLARKLGLTFSQVQKYEKGANRIGAGRLYIIAGILDVPVQYFFEGLEKTTPVPAKVNGISPSQGAELSVLDRAFLSIADHETRQSILALVRSLSAEPASSPRQSAG